MPPLSRKPVVFEVRQSSREVADRKVRLQAPSRHRRSTSPMPEALAGIERPGKIHRNLSAPELVELAVVGEEGVLAESGALVTKTGSRTGRSPKDRFFVAHGGAKEKNDW